MANDNTDTNLYGDVSKQIGTHGEAKMLEHAAPVLVLSKMGDVKPMPKNKSDNMNWRRPQSLPLATTPLTEGVTPPATPFDYDIVSVQLQEYGDWYPLSNKITDLHEHPVGAEISMMAGEAAAATVERITWGVIQGGVSVFRAGAGSAKVASRSDVEGELSLSMLRTAVKALKANKAKRITSVLDGSPKYNTTPVEPAYVALCHTDIEYQVRKLPGFIPAAEYGQRKLVCDEEFGTVENIRFVTSPDLMSVPDAGAAKGTGANELESAGGTNADVYPIVIIGQHAYGTVALKGQGAIVPKVRQPGQADSNDPMGRLGSVAWNTWYASKILNDLWMYRLEVACKVTPD